MFVDVCRERGTTLKEYAVPLFENCVGIHLGDQSKTPEI